MTYVWSFDQSEALKMAERADDVNISENGDRLETIADKNTGNNFGEILQNPNKLHAESSAILRV